MNLQMLRALSINRSELLSIVIQPPDKHFSVWFYMETWFKKLSLQLINSLQIYLNTTKVQGKKLSGVDPSTSVATLCLFLR